MNPIRFLRVVCLTLGLLLAGQLHAADAKKKMAAKPAKPTLEQAELRGLQRGITQRVKLLGKDLADVSEIKLHSDHVKVTLLKEPKPTPSSLWVELVVSEKAPRSAIELSAVNPQGESTRIKLHVDVLPQMIESSKDITHIPSLPVGVWGELSPLGDTDIYEFTVKSGQELVFELGVKAVGSGIPSPRLRLFDGADDLLTTALPLMPSEDAFLIHTFKQSGTYRIEVSDSTLGTSKEQFYRLSLGELPFVTLLHPNAVQVGKPAKIALLGSHLASFPSIEVEAKTEGETALPLPDDFRSRIPLKVLAEEWPVENENEPNDSPAQAHSVQLPVAISGTLEASKKSGDADSDIFRFDAQEGKPLMLDTLAAQRGSLADTKIEVLYPDGRPVPRVLLQATRDSWNKSARTVDPTAVEIRTEFWEEMELNQYLYMAGEVCKLYRWPFGPDSGFQMYFRNNKRVTYFGTTAASHALYEPFYIVEPHPPGTKLVPNGLPSFTLNYENDDDEMRDLGSDSRMLFTPPKTGTYLARISDSRGINGSLNNYQLTIRPAKPDFRVRVAGTNPNVPLGNGSGITIEVDRHDGFDGEVKVAVTGLPEGFYSSSPIVVQAGQFSAEGTLYALPDAKAPAMNESTNARVTASALINGQEITHEANSLGTVKLTPNPKFLLSLIPTNTTTVTIGSQTIPEIIIYPGETVSALIKVQRNSETNLVNLDMDNLPHGVIVDNVGLNGVQIRAGEDEREIFLMAFKWVPETDRLCQVVVKSARATAGSQGLQTSFPVMLKVRHRKPSATASAR